MDEPVSQTRLLLEAADVMYGMGERMMAAGQDLVDRARHMMAELAKTEEA